MRRFHAGIVLVVVLVVVLAAAQDASAQFRRRGLWYRRFAVGTGLRVATGGYGYPYGYGYGYPSGNYGGTTPYGDYARGMAQVIRARGQAAENYSRAQLNRQEALSKYIDNQKKWNELYRQRHEQAAADKQARLEAQRAWFKQHLARQRQQEPVLSASDRDPATGKINWPKALQTSEFAMLRKEIQDLFDLQAKTDGSLEIRRQTLAKTREMEDLLRHKMREMPKEDYLAARSFLDRMVNQSRS